MDLVGSFFSSAAIFFFFIGAAISLFFLNMLVLRRPSSSSSSEKLPPGPWRLPVIGSIHHLGGAQPHHRLRELSRKYGAVMRLQLGETPTVVVSSAEAAREVLRTHDGMFARRPNLPAADIVLYGSTNITFSPIGDYWKLLRKMCSLGMVNAKRVRSFQALREKEGSSLMKQLSEEARSSSMVNLSEKIFSIVFNITSKAAFGEKYKAREEILFISETMLKSSSRRSICDLFPSQKWLFVITGMKRKLETMHRMLDPVLEKIISGAEEEASLSNNKVVGGDKADDSLLSALLKVKEDGGFTLDTVKAVMLDMILGGAETSSATIEWAMTELLRNPRMMKRAQAEIRQVAAISDSNKGCRMDETCFDDGDLKYLKAVIKETLRLYPPAPLLIPRECSQTCEINGYTIPVGTQVLVNAWAIARDPNYWNDSAEEFMPDRFLDLDVDYKGFNFEYLPFGSGKRICPGMLFGEATVESVLAHLLCHFDWELPPGFTPETLDMTETLGMTMTRKSDLIVIPNML